MNTTSATVGAAAAAKQAGDGYTTEVFRGNFVLLGHSDGGSIALLFAADFEVTACAVMAPHVIVEDVSVDAILQAIYIANDHLIARDPVLGKQRVRTAELGVGRRRVDLVEVTVLEVQLAREGHGIVDVLETVTRGGGATTPRRRHSSRALCIRYCAT